MPGRRARRPGERRPQPTLDEKAARLAAFDLLARKSWSGRELTRRLRRRGAPAEIAQAVVADLTTRGYVDDQAFARWWAEARARGRRVGSRRLRQELLAKGIPREMTWEHPGGSSTASTHTPPAQPASLSGVAAPGAPAARSPFGKRA